MNPRDPASLSQPKLIDTHAHLTSNRFHDDFSEVLDRAQSAGVDLIITAGTTALDSRQGVELARQHAAIRPAVAIHPNDVNDRNDGDWDEILALAEDKAVVAIGETGLDRYWKRTPFELQVEYFELHLDLSVRKAMPVIIHCRDCYADVIECLRNRQGPISGVLHSFTGTRQNAETLLDLGLHLSFAGMVTFKNKELDALREVAAWVPDDRILVETDSPYLSPHPRRGKRNEPANVALTASLIADLRSQTLEDFATLTSQNAKALFGLNRG